MSRKVNLQDGFYSASRAETLDAIDLQTPTLGDLEDAEDEARPNADGGRNVFRYTRHVLSSVTGLPPEELRALSARDYHALDEVLGGMLAPFVETT